MGAAPAVELSNTYRQESLVLVTSERAVWSARGEY
jgi:hypothetical protein